MSRTCSMHGFPFLFCVKNKFTTVLELPTDFTQVSNFFLLIHLSLPSLKFWLNRSLKANF